MHGKSNELHLLTVYHGCVVVHLLKQLPLLSIHLLLCDLQEDFFEVSLILLSQSPLTVPSATSRPLNSILTLSHTS